MSLISKRSIGFAAGFFLSMQAAQATALTRVALVVGNSAYAHEPQLINPSRDATSVADSLRKAGFQTVTLITDADVVTFNKALRTFQDQALGADIAVLYYAGHGMEMNGVNYLIPVDATLKSDVDLPSQAVNQAVAQTATGGARLLSLIILDACRDNPLTHEIAITTPNGSVSRGLAPVDENELTANTLVEYSAESGALASDGDPSAGHSPYAAAIINHVQDPGLDVVFVFGKVRDDVMKATNTSQRPSFYGTHGGDPVYIVPPAQGATALAIRPRAAAFAAPPSLPASTPSLDQFADRTLWQTVVFSNDPARYQGYLAQYPDGDFAPLARLRLAYAPAGGDSVAANSQTLMNGYRLTQSGDASGALNLYRAVAATGDPVGQYVLGVAYSQGQGVTRDDAEAMIWHRLAAGRNYAPPSSRYASSTPTASASGGTSARRSNGAGSPRTRATQPPKASSATSMPWDLARPRTTSSL